MIMEYVHVDIAVSVTNMASCIMLGIYIGCDILTCKLNCVYAINSGVTSWLYRDLSRSGSQC